MKVMCIQFVEAVAYGRLPKPFFVDEKGRVLRQDFWNGSPRFLVGFAPKNKQEIKMGVHEAFWNLKAIARRKLYPVFAHADGEWFTYNNYPFTVTVKELKETDHADTAPKS